MYNVNMCILKKSRFFVSHHVGIVIRAFIGSPHQTNGGKKQTNVGPAIVKIPNEMQGHQPQNKHDLDTEFESDRDNGTKDIESCGSMCFTLASFDHDGPFNEN